MNTEREIVPKSQPLIRLLGRLLGEVIREQHGAAALALVEDVRRVSVGEHRDKAETARLDQRLEGMSQAELLLLIRAFAIFSQLANIADDQQARREARSQRGQAARLTAGLDAARVGDFLEGALLQPVITAHPTEVRRKSTIDHRNKIFEIMRMRDRGVEETAEGEPLEQALKRQIALLWQTRPLRKERIFVSDEVEIALSYLRDVFLPLLPALYGHWEQALGTSLPRRHRRRPRR